MNAASTFRAQSTQFRLQRAAAWLIPSLWLAAWLVPLPVAAPDAPLTPVAADHFWRGLPEICLFHRLTGWSCPGCGMTRSLVSSAHGAWSNALAFHPLGPLLFLIVLGWAAFILVAPRPVSASLERWLHARQAWLSCATVAAFLSVAMVRWLGFWPAP